MDLTKHTPFPWWLHESMVIMSGHGMEIRAVAYASKADGEIIVSAVNNTYGKGIDPSKLLNAVPDNGDGKICLNCRHWRDKSWVNEKGWGICDNEINETRLFGLSFIKSFVKDNDQINELTAFLEDNIRFPHNFGCRFFEALEGS